jgi:hypothetical protein
VLPVTTTARPGHESTGYESNGDESNGYESNGYECTGCGDVRVCVPHHPGKRGPAGVCSDRTPLYPSGR